jgi:long-chain acyl-CoA synthetase
LPPAASTTASLRAVQAPAASIGELLRRAVARWGPRVALRRRREALQWGVLTWTELGQQVDALAGGLLHIGVRPGDRVALMSNTRLEWSLVDYAVLSLGAATVPVYHSCTAQQAAWVLADSGASVLIVDERTTLERIRGALEELPALRRILVLEVMDLRGDPKVSLFDEVLKDGRRFVREHPLATTEVLRQVEPDTLATLVYTSGTTGRPKGVRLTHRNLLAAVESLDGLVDAGTDDTTVLALPLSHIYARLGQFFALQKGFAIAYAQRVDVLADVLKEVRPTFFFAVPRIYERIYHEVSARYRELPGLLQGVLRRGVDATRTRLGEPAPRHRRTEMTPLTPKEASVWDLGRFARRWEERAADRAIFQPVRDALGGRIRFCLSGGAPLNPDVARFFRLAGVEILEGYGLTETVGAATLNPITENRIGTVGRPVPGMRVRIAQDGEILLGGAMVFDGYHEQPVETAYVLDDSGWFHTGDVGHLDEAGFLVITDRKKDLIVLSGAKNVSPQHVESVLRSSPYIADAMVFGDRRPAVVALLVLNEDEILRFCKGLDIAGEDLATLGKDPRVLRLLQEEIDRVCQRLTPFERVRRWRILPRALSIEGGELTPTLKVRRKAIEERNRPFIEAMYDELPKA